MPAKITFICLIHSVVERDSNDYIIREGIAVLRKEDNASMNIKVTSFIPKKKFVPQWVPNFQSGDVLRFTGKFALDEEPPHNNILEVIIFTSNTIHIICYIF
jgi:hypothetical protein